MDNLVLLSGGMDSTTLLYLVDQGKPPEDTGALVIDYGQRHVKEIKAALNICAWKKIKAWRASVPMMWLIHHSLMQGGEEKAPAQSEGRQADTVIVGRNAYFLSIAVSYAGRIGASSIYIGSVLDDFEAYPDCRPEFIKDMDSAFSKAYGIRVFAPLINFSKHDLVTIGLKLNVPYDLTWSCYRGEDEPCMECDACRERMSAFSAHGLDYYGKEFDIE